MVTGSEVPVVDPPALGSGAAVEVSPPAAVDEMLSSTFPEVAGASEFEVLPRDLVDLRSPCI